jgi:transcriptional regulator with XRE-family HTH domain
MWEGEKMTNIWNHVQFNPSERPKYTRYELAKMVREKRKNDGLTQEEMADKLNVDLSIVKQIEEASRTFNAKMYKLVSSIIGKSITELTSKETDDTLSISFRASEQKPEIEAAVMIANLLFDEIIMQEKISTR